MIISFAPAAVETPLFVAEHSSNSHSTDSPQEAQA